jgi:hypothetical protein
VLTTLDKTGKIEDSAAVVADLKIHPKEMDAALKSLNVDDYVKLEVIELKQVELTAEGKGYLEKGTPEYQYTQALEFDQVVVKAEFDEKVGKQLAKIGFQKAMSNKWVQLCGEGKKNVKRVAQDIVDGDKSVL